MRVARSLRVPITNRDHKLPFCARASPPGRVGADGARRYRLLPGTRSPRAPQSKGKLARLRARQSDLSPTVRSVRAGRLLRSSSRQDEVRGDRESEEGSDAWQPLN